MISVKDLRKRLGNQEVLKGVSFHVEPGSIFGIVGPSGAGKSTLFRCLSGLVPPDSGVCEGTHHLGILFQHCPLLSSQTVFANVALPLVLKGKDPKKALEALNQVGLAHLASRYPAELSGGQKQKVALARALVSSPSALLLDEPSSALDPQSTKELQELLLKLNKEGLTILVITHEMDLVRALASEVAVMDNGTIVEMGRVVDLFGNPQHPVTKALLEQMHHPLPEGLIKDCLRLHFRGTTAKEPIISSLIKQHNVEINILKGALDTVQSEIIGELTISLKGPETEKAIAYLESKGVGIERLSC